MGWLSDAPVGVGPCVAIKRRRRLRAQNSGAERRPDTRATPAHSAVPAQLSLLAELTEEEHAAAPAVSLTHPQRYTGTLRGLPHPEPPAGPRAAEGEFKKEKPLLVSLYFVFITVNENDAKCIATSKQRKGSKLLSDRLGLVQSDKRDHPLLNVTI